MLRKTLYGLSWPSCILFPGYPAFSIDQIIIDKGQAWINWTLDADLVDSVLVIAIDANDDGNYIHTKVEGEQLEVYPVAVDLPEASKFVFDFEVYKGDDLLVERRQVESK